VFLKACSFLWTAEGFFFPVPLSDILRGKLPALTGGLLFSFLKVDFNPVTTD
jgi:hypothetical protein